MDPKLSGRHRRSCPRCRSWHRLRTGGGSKPTGFRNCCSYVLSQVGRPCTTDQLDRVPDFKEESVLQGAEMPFQQHACLQQVQAPTLSRRKALGVPVSLHRVAAGNLDFGLRGLEAEGPKLRFRVLGFRAQGVYNHPPMTLRCDPHWTSTRVGVSQKSPHIYIYVYIHSPRRHSRIPHLPIAYPRIPRVPHQARFL